MEHMSINEGKARSGMDTENNLGSSVMANNRDQRDKFVDPKILHWVSKST